ncbi:hypothetical protein MM326_03350 [Alkalihalobacillus sp. LMS6]|uniref:hypothetical protein n=1 Tax=Alkalihalobacillus sp. LMS6 TaxID=2924034 RepID=UPI0020D0C73E|nr:hypothetical protein [Alkalihalobacillus sp. LMS6]UTR07083.1 hypothetical protein MM326_03350 [Alkalihalobacillus sp. LMS6]
MFTWRSYTIMILIVLLSSAVLLFNLLAQSRSGEVYPILFHLYLAFIPVCFFATGWITGSSKGSTENKWVPLAATALLFIYAIVILYSTMRFILSLI